MKQLSTHINFMGMRKPAVFLSGALIFISLAMLLFRGLELGVDFTGGTVMELSYPSAVEPTEIKALLEKEGFEDLTVQHFGSIEKVLIRIAPQKKQEVDVEKKPVAKQDKKSVLSNKVLQVLQMQVADVKMDRVEFVGPQIGEELREQGGLAMLYALIGILIYITLRFEFRFSVGAIVALIHDVVITLGFFAITRVEFDLTVLAAILAIIGYSLNDTIVVFDRVRENFTVLRKKEPEEILNASVNQTLSRTIVTSLTTLLVLLALYFIGGEAVHAFAAAMIVGVVV
ncbi:MAG TPA: protein translocase subunit SecF, partial [Thiothrix sp.]|nr:protein translocase subunit SecF [Thiothrix sp.]